MNDITQKMIEDFEAVATAAAETANLLFSCSDETQDQPRVTKRDIFVEHGQLWVIVSKADGYGWQQNIPLAYLGNNDWLEDYKASLVPESKKTSQPPEEGNMLTALEESEKITLQKRSPS